MLYDTLPIEIYVSTRFKDKAILALIENWRIEPEDLQKTLVTYYKEMGIFSVTPQLDASVNASMKTLLINSPDIFTRVRKAEQQELMRRQSRRNDVGK